MMPLRQDNFHALQLPSYVPCIAACDGLQTLAAHQPLHLPQESGRLELARCPGRHMQFSLEWFAQHVVRPYLAVPQPGPAAAAGAAAAAAGQQGGGQQPRQQVQR